MSEFIEFELSVLDVLQQLLSHDWLNPFWIFVSWLGNAGAIWIILTIALLIYPRTRVVGWMCVVSLLLSGLVTNVILKNLVGRPRPFSYHGFEILIKAPWDHSFPSGHTSAAFSFAFVVLKQRLSIGVYKVYKLLLLLAALISLSRLALYLHFPSDVIASIIVAYMIAWAAVKFLDRWQGSNLNPE